VNLRNEPDDSTVHSAYFKAYTGAYGPVQQRALRRFKSSCIICLYFNRQLLKTLAKSVSCREIPGCY